MPHWAFKFPMSAILDFGNNLFVIGAFKGWIATEHDIEDYAYAPQVAFFIVDACKDFWRNVVSSSILQMSFFFISCRKSKKCQNR
jgi:hypothetical protein